LDSHTRKQNFVVSRCVLFFSSFFSKNIHLKCFFSFCQHKKKHMSVVSIFWFFVCSVDRFVCVYASKVLFFLSFLFVFVFACLCPEKKNDGDDERASDVKWERKRKNTTERSIFFIQLIKDSWLSPSRKMFCISFYCFNSKSNTIIYWWRFCDVCSWLRWFGIIGWLMKRRWNLK
jgi:hypothetical protein